GSASILAFRPLRTIVVLRLFRRKHAPRQGETANCGLPSERNLCTSRQCCRPLGLRPPPPLCRYVLQPSSRPTDPALAQRRHPTLLPDLLRFQNTGAAPR